MTRGNAPTQRWTRLATRVLAPNAGPMTLDGTNSLVLSRSGSAGVIVVDPGPLDAEHLKRLCSLGDTALILLTHHHHDHADAAPELAAVTGAPVRAIDPALCISAGPLVDREIIEAAGIRVEVIATPGHTHDSACLHLPDDQAIGRPKDGGVVISGDTILGRGSTVITHPGGSLADYLDSLDRLAGYGALSTLPGHGPMIADLAAVCRRLSAHRAARLDELRTVLGSLGEIPSHEPRLVAVLVDMVYGAVDPSLRFAAEICTRAQLAYLAGAGQQES